MIEWIEDKKLVKELEYNTIPIVNIYTNFFKLYHGIISWYHNIEGIDANTSIYKKWNKISELLGHKPITHPIHLYKNALWVFNWKNENNNVLIYYDKRGIKIQVNEKFRKDEIENMLNYIRKKLINS